MQWFWDNWTDVVSTVSWLIATVGWAVAMWLVARLRKETRREREVWSGMDRAREWEITRLGARVAALERVAMWRAARADAITPGEMPDQPTLRELSLLRPQIPPPAEMR